jgi:hypothetical protein
MENQKNDEAGRVVMSAYDLVPFVPEGSLRTYYLAPLSYGARRQFRAELKRVAGDGADRGLFLAAVRDVVATRAEAEAPEAAAKWQAQLAVIDEAISDPGNAVAVQRVRLIETQIEDEPAYRRIAERQTRWAEEMPPLAARYSLRGWAGPGLPEFPVQEGARAPIPPEVLDHIPAAELAAVGNHAYFMTVVTSAAVGNSGAR